MPSRPEPWLRGSVAGIPAVLQPASHALQHAREDVRAALATFPHARLDARPAGVASVRFHLRHMSGVLDRMATYARGQALSPAQFDALRAEEAPGADSAEALVEAFEARIDAFLSQLRATGPETLAEARTVGRERLPSTVLGILFHAAEHVQRHVGQLVVTARVVAE